MVSIGETRLVAKVTGPDSINATPERFGVHGTDLGILWDGGDGRVRVLFGDTYGSGWCGSGAGPPEADWRCNVLGFSSTRALEEGLRLDEFIGGPEGSASQLFGTGKGNEVTLIPNAGITIDGVDFVHYMSVREWGKPGEWWTNYASIRYSTDGGAHWHTPAEPLWPNDADYAQRFQIGAFARTAEHVYLFGTTNGRFADAYLARVHPKRLLEPEAYEYRTTRGWTPDSAAAEPVLTGPIGELSVAYDNYLSSWIALHLDEHRAAIVLRTAPQPDGPWSAGEPLVTGADYPALYGGYLHPWSLDGPDLHYLISQWGPYNVFHMSTRLSP